MSNNIIGDIGSELVTTVKQTVKQVAKTPLKILETGVSQVSGQKSNTKMGIDENNQGQSMQSTIKQMKINDDINSQAQMNQIRQNLQAMMQSPKAQEEIPKYIAGKPGFSMDKVIQQEEEEKKAKNKLPDLSQLLKTKGQGTAERFKGVSG
jgi:hypothetical protein